MNKMGRAAVLALVAFAVSMRCILGREYTVGDVYCLDTVPVWGRYCNYQGWSLDKDFFVGDTLVFRFSSVSSTVAEVTKEDFDGCSKSLLPSKPIRVYELSPVTVKLSTAGPMYIANTIEDCNRQRFAIIVNVPAPPSPDAVPSTSTPSNVPSSKSTTTPSSTSAAMTSSSATPPPPAESSKSHGSSIAGEVTGVVFGVVAFMAKIWLVTYCVQKRKKNKQRLNNGQVHNEDDCHEMNEFEQRKVMV